MSKKASKKSPPKKSARKPARTAATKKPANKPVKKPANKPVRKAAKKPAVKAAPSSVLRDHAIGIATFAHGMTARAASGFAPDQVTAQTPGCANHALWTLGHLASTASWLATLVDGKPHSVPESYYGLFGPGSKPVSDPATYPPFDEVRRAFDDTFQRLVSAASGMSDEEMKSPCLADSMGFCADKLDVLHKGAWHEGWHVGQLATLRRELGLPTVFGA
jgi:hypothetical protein